MAAVVAVTAVVGAAASIWGGVESRNANRRAEQRNREQEEEYQRQVAQQRLLAEEQARLEKERLLKNIGFKREELEIQEVSFKARQDLEQKQAEEKIGGLRQTYEDAFSECNVAQTIRGLTQTLAPRKSRLTHDYLKDNEGLALFKSYVQTQTEQGLKGMSVAKRELDSMEQLGKESNELNLKGITNKAEAELQMSQFRIRGMREQMSDLNSASLLNDFGTLFKMGAQIATPYIEKGIYKNQGIKFNYGGNSYDELMNRLNFASSLKKPSGQGGLSSVFS